MEIRSRTLFSTLTWVCLCISMTSITRSSASNLLGVSPQDYKYYQDGFSYSSKKLKCKDGSNQFSMSQFNDDFCDCPDGSDEPGTSACPNGKFHCMNAGHVPLSIFSSRVNDGICDCCDGSDEYDGRINCTNTCWEAGKVARDKLKKKIATYKQGTTIRRREIEQAKVAIAKDEAELSKLKGEEKILKRLVDQLKERKEQIERAEEKERLQKEKEEKEEKERLEKEKEEKERKEAEEAKHHEINDKIHASSTEDSASSQGCAFCDRVWDSKKGTYREGMGVADDSGSPEVGHTEKSQDGAVKDEGEEAGHPQEDSPHVSSNLEEETSSTDKVGHAIEGEETTEDPAPLSREELGRRIASRWTGEKTEEKPKESDTGSSNDHENSEDIDESLYEEDNYELDEEEHKYDDQEEHKYDDQDEHKRDDEEHKYGSDADDDDDDDDDDDSDDHAEDIHNEDQVDSTSSYNSEDEVLDPSEIDSPSWLEKLRKTVRKILNAVNYFQGPVDQSEAAHVRKEYDESSTKLTKIQSRISSLTKKLKQDFGPDKEFHSFYGQCFEIKENKYVYKICPFKEASQVEGYSTTRLGNWNKFEESYRVMQFSNGEKCWNGPDRSLKVRLRCGLKNEATDVDEPSRCEYAALLATPALCHEDKLKELEDKLEMMNAEHQNQSHDEL